MEGQLVVVRCINPRSTAHLDKTMTTALDAVQLGSTIVMLGPSSLTDSKTTQLCSVARETNDHYKRTAKAPAAFWPPLHC